MAFLKPMKTSLPLNVRGLAHQYCYLLVHGRRRLWHCCVKCWATATRSGLYKPSQSFLHCTKIFVCTSTLFRIWFEVNRHIVKSSFPWNCSVDVDVMGREILGSGKKIRDNLRHTLSIYFLRRKKSSDLHCLIMLHFFMSAEKWGSKIIALVSCENRYRSASCLPKPVMIWLFILSCWERGICCVSHRSTRGKKFGFPPARCDVLMGESWCHRFGSWPNFRCRVYACTHVTSDFRFARIACDLDDDVVRFVTMMDTSIVEQVYVSFGFPNFLLLIISHELLTSGNFNSPGDFMKTTRWFATHTSKALPTHQVLSNKIVPSTDLAYVFFCNYHHKKTQLTYQQILFVEWLPLSSTRRC